MCCSECAVPRQQASAHRHLRGARVVLRFVTQQGARSSGSPQHLTTKLARCAVSLVLTPFLQLCEARKPSGRSHADFALRGQEHACSAAINTFCSSEKTGRDKFDFRDGGDGLLDCSWSPLMLEYRTKGLRQRCKAVGPAPLTGRTALAVARALSNGPQRRTGPRPTSSREPTDWC